MLCLVGLEKMWEIENLFLRSGYEVDKGPIKLLGYWRFTGSCWPGSVTSGLFMADTVVNSSRRFQPLLIEKENSGLFCVNKRTHFQRCKWNVWFIIFSLWLPGIFSPQNSVGHNEVWYSRDSNFISPTSFTLAGFGVGRWSLSQSRSRGHLWKSCQLFAGPYWRIWRVPYLAQGYLWKVPSATTSTPGLKQPSLQQAELPTSLFK